MSLTKELWKKSLKELGGQEEETQERGLLVSLGTLLISLFCGLLGGFPTWEEDGEQGEGRGLGQRNSMGLSPRLGACSFQGPKSQSIPFTTPPCQSGSWTWTQMRNL